MSLPGGAAAHATTHPRDVGMSRHEALRPDGDERRMQQAQKPGSTVPALLRTHLLHRSLRC
jgi:hypothetical protein